MKPETDGRTSQKLNRNNEVLSRNNDDGRQDSPSAVVFLTPLLGAAIWALIIYLYFS